MNAEDHVRVDAVLLVIAAFFGQEQRPVGGSLGGVVDGDVLRSLGHNGECGQRTQGRNQAENGEGSHDASQWRIISAPVIKRKAKHGGSVERPGFILSWMLDQAKNQLLTEVGPGTPMGGLLRRYWMPIAAVTEFDDNSIKPVRCWAKT